MIRTAKILRQKFENNKNCAAGEIFWVFYKAKTRFLSKNQLFRGQNVSSEKFKIIKARRRRIFLDNKSCEKKFEIFFRIIKAVKKSESQKSLRGVLLLMDR